MTPLPKRRLSTRRQGKRRATHVVATMQLSTCPKCHQPRLGHRACKSCGFYK